MKMHHFLFEIFLKEGFADDPDGDKEGDDDEEGDTSGSDSARVERQRTLAECLP